jgi:hypothetical protein
VITAGDRNVIKTPVINAAILQQLANRCSGHAMKIIIPNATTEQISKALGDKPHRILNAVDPAALDDKMPTIVTGCDDMSRTEFNCFISKMESLRFRDVLIFPTKTWAEPEDFYTIPFWDKIGNVMKAVFSNRCAHMELEVEDDS